MMEQPIIWVQLLAVISLTCIVEYAFKVSKSRSDGRYWPKNSSKEEIEL